LTDDTREGSSELLGHSGSLSLRNPSLDENALPSPFTIVSKPTVFKEIPDDDSTVSCGKGCVNGDDDFDAVWDEMIDDPRSNPDENRTVSCGKGCINGDDESAASIGTWHSLTPSPSVVSSAATSPLLDGELLDGIHEEDGSGEVSVEHNQPSCRPLPEAPSDDASHMWHDAEDVDRGVCATPCAGACICGTKAITVGSTWFTEVPGVVAECDVYDNWDPRSCDAILEDVSRYTWAQFVLCCCILASSLVLAGTLIFIRLSQPSDTLSVVFCARKACRDCGGCGSTPLRSNADTEACEGGFEIGSLHPACRYTPPSAGLISAQDRISCYTGMGLETTKEGYVGGGGSVTPSEDSADLSMHIEDKEQGLVASNV
jgi:hypothetical protein